MTASSPIPITLPERRSTASTLLAEASGLPVLTGRLLVDSVDLATWAVLAHIGLTDLEVRLVAATLWGER